MNFSKAADALPPHLATYLNRNMSSKRSGDEIDEQQPYLKIAKIEEGGGGDETNNPISAYSEDVDDILAAAAHHASVPPLPGHLGDDDVGEPTSLTHMTAADVAAEAVDAINEAVQEAGILNDTDCHQHHLDGVTHVLPTVYDTKMITGTKSQKERTEFTASQKLQILAELDAEHPPSVQSVIQKWGVSKSSLHRWKQPAKRERLHEMAGPGGAGSKMKRDTNDKFAKLKSELRRFCKENATQPESAQYEINSPFIQVKSREIRDELLRRHGDEPFLEEKEVDALQQFQGSKSWACVTGNELGYLSANKGDNAVLWSEAAKANTAAYLHQMRPPTESKKSRVEFTAQEKLDILKEMEANDPDKPNLTVKQICQKYNTSKSSLHRWQHAYKSGKLQEAVESNGMGSAKRIFRDKLNPIKAALHEFVKENESLPYDKQVPILYSTLQHKALLKKEELLAQHQAENNLTEDEFEALQNFKASNSWLRELSRRMGWQLTFVDGQKGTPLIPEEYQYDPAAYEQQAVYDQEGYVVAEQEQYGGNQVYDVAVHVAPGESIPYAIAQDVEPAPVEGRVCDTDVHNV